LLIVAALACGVQSASLSQDALLDELIKRVLAGRDSNSDDLGLLAPNHHPEARDVELLPPDRHPESRTEFLNTAKKAVTNYHINMCFYCDDNCLAKIGGADHVGNFYEDIASRVQSMLNTIYPSKYQFTTSAAHKIMPKKAIQFLYFKRKADSSKNAVLLANVNENFWTYRDLYQKSMDAGCDADFLTVSADDMLWASNYVGNVDGIANVMGMCSGYAFSAVKLNPDSTRMATLVAHELGHILGMSHDGVGDAGTDCSFGGKYAVLTAPCNRVATECTASNHGCADGPNNCLMSESVGTETKYSTCSQAYFDWYSEMANLARNPDSYDLTCIEASDKKRKVRGELLD